MQVLFFLDQLEFKACSYRLVLQTVVILNVINQLLEQVSAVVDLEKGCILLLVRVDASDLMLHGTVVVLMIFAMLATMMCCILRLVEADCWLHLLIKVQHFNYVSFLAVAWPSVMRLSSSGLLISLRSEQVILSLILIDAIFMPFVFMATGYAILVNDGRTDARMFLT